MNILGELGIMGTAPELQWWITVIELPALVGLFWMVMRNSAALNQYKLDVAEKYASVAHLQEVEGRITRMLERIERKLDHETAPPE